jgi:hypothetical protein
MNQAIRRFLDRGRRYGTIPVGVARYAAHGYISPSLALVKGVNFSDGITNLYDNEWEALRHALRVGHPSSCTHCVTQGKLDDFAHAFQQSIQGFSLRVAIFKGRNHSDVMARLIFFDDDGEVARNEKRPRSLGIEAF